MFYNTFNLATLIIPILLVIGLLVLVSLRNRMASVDRNMAILIGILGNGRDIGSLTQCSECSVTL